MKRFIIDTDPGVDDALALAYVAAHTDVAEVVAIGSIHGNVDARTAAKNALRLIERLDRLAQQNIPVAIGANAPLLGQRLHSGQHVHGPDGFGGHAGPPSKAEPAAETAADQLVRLARQHPGQLSILALGPLTNLAIALRTEPALPELISDVTWMGGAISVPGNITPHAEANAWHDPEATEQVLAAGFTTVMVPLDVTSQAWAGRSWWDIVAAHDHPLCQYVTAIASHYIRRYSRSRGRIYGESGCLLHDPLAAAIALDPDLASFEQHQICVELTGTHTRGATLLDRRVKPRPLTTDPTRRPVSVAVRADIETMLRRLHEALLL